MSNESERTPSPPLRQDLSPVIERLRNSRDPLEAKAADALASLSLAPEPIPEMEEMQKRLREQTVASENLQSDAANDAMLIKSLRAEVSRLKALAPEPILKGEVGEMVKRLKERIEKINEKSVLAPAIEAANAPGLAGFQNDHKQFSKGWDGCARRVTAILAEAADLLSRLSAALQETERVRDDWCAEYTQARDDLSAAREAVLADVVTLIAQYDPWVFGCGESSEVGLKRRDRIIEAIWGLKSAAGSGEGETATEPR